MEPTRTEWERFAALVQFLATQATQATQAEAAQAAAAAAAAADVKSTARQLGELLSDLDSAAAGALTQHAVSLLLVRLSVPCSSAPPFPAHAYASAGSEEEEL